MTKRISPVRIISVLLILFAGIINLAGQDNMFQLSGKILESGSGKPLQQAVISVVSTGEFTNTDTTGTFSITLPSPIEQILVSYPGYYNTEVYTNGEEEMVFYVTPIEFKSDNEIFSSAIGTKILKNATNTVSLITQESFGMTAVSSADQTLTGKVAGLNVIEHSGMPGHSSWLNIRGVSSIFGRNQPLVLIDGMIHEIDFPNNYRIEGHLLNPMNIVDVDDIVDIDVIKVPEAYLGSAGSNGQIYINTEQKKETSASILVKMYGGIALAPKPLDVLDANQFSSYITSLLTGEGYSVAQINQEYPWLNGGPSVDEYYRYNNNTNWQKELYKPAALQKYYIFLKGGDDIATYNISTGYLRHGAQFDQWRYSRYNLRLNGKVNITNKLSVVPNTKLSLSDTYLSNMGPTAQHNPVISSLLKPPIMAPNERSEVDGTVLFPYDDVGAFGLSNPAVLIDEAMGSNRNFQLLTSVKIAYAFNPNFSISHLIGTSVNNDRINIFIPDNGVVQIDFARNSPQDMVTEFRSTQNHTQLKYTRELKKDHQLKVLAGMRQMNNIYKNNQAIDLNTPSDDFRSLGQGSELEFLKENDGELYEVKWISYYGDFDYNFRDKYFLRASTSLDGASVFNRDNRYNFYPAIFAAWRPNSSESMKNSRINDLKLRVSFSQSGNMFSNIYQFSKLTYTGRRYTDLGVVVRDYNPNEEMKVERKSTYNAGMDMALARKSLNLHVDLYLATVNNLIINQQLPYNYGFTDYYDNGGSIMNTGAELAADWRKHFGKATLVVDATATYQLNVVNSLDFINPNTEFLIREVYGAEYIASEGKPLNAFYGYKTSGIYNSDGEAGGIIGPNGIAMGAGDVIFENTDGNNVIDNDDKQIIGNPNPDVFGSVSGLLKVNRFEFSLLLTYSVGNDIYNYVRYKASAMENYANQSTDVLNRWQPGSPSSEIPRASIGDLHGNSVFSDRWIEDGSYLRVKQFRVSYTTPKIFQLQKEATFYVTGANLFTLTKYTGSDPETLYLNDPYFMGIDYGKIPQTQTIIVGIQLSL